MIERTICDLRIAEHWGRATRVNAQGWRHRETRPTRAARAALAQALVTLAARLDPAPREAPATLPSAWS